MDISAATTARSATVLTVIVCIVSVLATVGGDEQTLGLKLTRLKRQQAPDASAANGGQASSGAGQAGASGSSSPSDASGSAGANQESQQDGSGAEEVLNGLKCDFGTADAPDMCKFRLLDSANPLAKSMGNHWMLGSGRTALYQGGPLMDASGTNDTSGSYIFYETSNPFVSANSSGADGPAGAPEHPPAPPSSYLLKSADQSGQSAAQQQVLSSARVQVSSPAGPAGPAFVSANLTAPSGSAAMCLSFAYAIQGLSADELRVHVNDLASVRSRLIWTASESLANNWTRGEVLYSAGKKHSVSFSAAPSSTSAAKDLQQRMFRGYIALDEIEVAKHDSQAAGEAACRGHCNFDGDLCGWTNGENGQDDDFDWSFGRGSDNLFTGPARDYLSSTNNELTGGYLFTDSAYPRRPGDRALLLSPQLPATPVNEALCMRLAVHMFGSGVGSLAIKIRYADAELASAGAAGAPGGAQPAPIGGQAPAAGAGKGQTNPAGDLTIWEMSGDAGNNWHQARVSVSSAKSPFQVLVEGVIGDNRLGNMAIDEISFSAGACPTSPPVASKNYGDCTFEQSMCYWRNPDADIHLDDLDWIRSADEQSIHGPNHDHTLKRRSGSFLKLENTLREPKSGSRAFLLSPIFAPKASGSVQCLSFYYYMFMRSVSSSGPNLGTIRVYLASNNELVPIWRLTNPISSASWKQGRASLSSAMLDGQPLAPSKLFQIAFEGIWGDAAGGAIALDDITVFDGACDIMPAEAKSVPGECTFDVDLCSWSNKTGELTADPGADASDSQRSPFLQSVGGIANSNHQAMAALARGAGKQTPGWQLATVDNRPVNLQDHTYRAPIGYVYVDSLEGAHTGGQPIPLASAESTVQPGAQLLQCLSFWFAAFGRRETNQLSVHLTQASAAPSGGTGDAAPPGGRPGSAGVQTPAGANQATAAAAPGAGSADEPENSQAWKMALGKLIWSISLRNITENQRRKWHYGQVSLRADSNYLVRFVAIASDGGFALDDVSYYEGACDTRPPAAKVTESEEEQAGQEQAGQAGATNKPAGGSS